jgi:hypothetical protein
MFPPQLRLKPQNLAFIKSHCVCWNATGKKRHRYVWNEPSSPDKGLT